MRGWKMDDAGRIADAGEHRTSNFEEGARNCEFVLSDLFSWAGVFSLGVQNEREAPPQMRRKRTKIALPLRSLRWLLIRQWFKSCSHWKGSFTVWDERAANR